ncbi:MarR family transcriptional regulator [Patescibacteria group bacterium]|nr:MarR family transcriptional regulator [Patescibacteria group bacterium]
MQEDDIERGAERLIFILPDISKVFRMQHPGKFFNIDISISELSVLHYLFFKTKPSMSEMGKDLAVDLSTLTRIVDKLVKKNLIVRKPDLKDRRVVRVAMSRKGRAIGEKFKQEHKEKVKSILKQMMPEERNTFLNLLETIHTRICPIR